MSVSQTSWHKEVILGRNSVFRVFRLYLGSSDHARALNRDMSVSQTSWHKEVILGRNSVFRVFRLYLGSSDLRFNA
jgi:hypothetical protein